MTTPSRKTAYSKAQLEEMAVPVDYWWHSIDLGMGQLPRGLRRQKLSDMNLNRYDFLT